MKKQLQSIRQLLGIFIVLLFLSGLTAIPVDAELTKLLQFFWADTILHRWLEKVLLAFRSVRSDYPFLLYGYDWLAFAHFILAILFIGPYKDPVKNIWVIEFGMIACVLILPFAMIAGPLRGIPFGWRCVDGAFGVFGFIPLRISFQKTKQLIALQNS